MAISTVTPLLPAPDPGAQKPLIIDAYRQTITNPDVTDIDSAVRAFFTNSPGWLVSLMKFRNAVVARIGFKTVDNDRRELPERFEPGTSIGVFDVLQRSADEIVMGGDDTHFTFRLSLWIPPGSGELQVTTIGHHVTARGRAYLSVVAPGHRLIAPMMTKRVTAGVT